MKRLALAGSLTALLALTLAFAACGGDDDDGGSSTSDIRTNSGLEVANLVAALNNGDDASGFFAPGAAPAIAEDGDATNADRSAGGLSAGDQAAPGFAPAFQTAGGTGISAYGYGSATATADSALIDFYFYRYSECCIEPVPEPGTVPPDAPTDSDGDGSTDSGSGSSGSSGGVDVGVAEDKPIQAGEVTPITEADLQPVIDALNAAGASDVEFIGQSYYDVYSSSATIRATVNNVDSVDAVVQAGTDAGNALSNGITASGNNVSYTLQDCEALTVAAMTAAVEDARSRAETLAGVLGVSIGEVIGAADSSYNPYGSAPCSSSYYGPIPVFDSRGASGAEGAAGPGEVQVFSSLAVTYAIN
jgi:uncharacterized protein YggE